MSNMIKNDTVIGIEDGRTSYWYRMEQIVNIIWLPFFGSNIFTVYALLCGLAEQGSGRTDITRIEKGDIAKACRIRKSSVYEALDHLMELGFIAMGEKPTPSQKRLGIKRKIRVLDAPRQITQAHIKYGLEKRFIADVSSVEEFFDKYVMFKWLFNNEPAPTEDNWQTSSLTTPHGNLYKFHPEPVVPSEQVPMGTSYKEKEINIENMTEENSFLSRDVGDDGAEETDVALSSDTKKSNHTFETHYDTDSKIYDTQLEANDLALVIMGAVQKNSGKACDSMTGKQYQQLGVKTRTKDGRAMESPQWYYEAYPEVYRWFIETRVPELVRHLPDKVHSRHSVGMYIKILTNPDHYRGWRSVMEKNNLRKGAPNDGYQLTAGGAQPNPNASPAPRSENTIDYSAWSRFMRGDE